LEDPSHSQVCILSPAMRQQGTHGIRECQRRRKVFPRQRGGQNRRVRLVSVLLQQLRQRLRFDFR
jgi:hypothetical protein